jgi:hypothetical protein
MSHPSSVTLSETEAVMPAAPQPKGWLATFAVLLIMVGIVVGGCVAAAATSSIPDKPVEIGQGVSLLVPPGWQYTGRTPEGNTILLSRGGGNVAITADAGTDERAALAKLRDEWLATGTVTAGEMAAITDARSDQKPASRFAYSGTFPDEPGGAVEGEVTGVRGSGIIVVFDAWAGIGEFVNVKDDVAAIIRDTNIP